MAGNVTSWPRNPVREQFHVPDNYFLSHSVGCQPRRTAGALNAHFHLPWQNGRNWDDWMEPLDSFRAGIGQVINAPAANICPQTNISSALTKIIHSLPFDPKRPNILLTRQDFPTIGFVLQQATRIGYRLRFIDDAPTDLANWQAALDETVAFAHITHALSNTSRLLPVAEICAAARAAGALSIIDAAQSLIIAPVDVASWQADFLTATSVKFLCGGPGACCLYASDAMLARCAPIDVGWFSHADPFEMDIQDFRYASDAMRFFGGTPSPAPLVAANAALETWAGIGLAAVQSRIHDHLQTLTSALPDSAIASPLSAPRGATLVITPPDRPALSAALSAANIRHDERPEGFRFSVHGYTSDEETHYLVDQILSAL